jgi:energy-coupling factor transporter ATP-binding protein EcfA2
MPRIAARNRRQQPTRFEVFDLHSRFTYRIELPTEDRPVRFLSAPNGYGKSTLLQMVNDLTHYRWEALARTIFRQATLHFDRGAKLTLARAIKDEGHTVLTVKCISPDQDDIERRVDIVRSMTPWIRGNAGTGFENAETGEPLCNEEATRFMRSDAPTGSTRSELRVLTHQLDRVLGIPAVYYLDAQRLRHHMRDEATRAELPGTRGEGSEYAVNQVSSRIAGIMRRVSFDYGRTSRAADRAYLPRALKALRRARPANQIDPQALAERYAQLREQESNLQSLALTDGVMDAISEEECRSTDQTALLLLDQFLDDVERRFAVLERTAKQFTLFRDTLNSMFEHKKIGFNTRLVLGRGRRVGIYAVSDEGQEIPLTALSSGEQHLIVMFGRILFDSDCMNGGLVLLDEPEISLHPQWQMALSQALKEVAVLNKCRMLLATHSPTMIGNDWDSETALSPLEEA